MSAATRQARAVDIAIRREGLAWQRVDEFGASAALTLVGRVEPMTLGDDAGRVSHVEMLAFEADAADVADSPIKLGHLLIGPDARRWIVEADAIVQNGIASGVARLELYG